MGNKHSYLWEQLQLWHTRPNNEVSRGRYKVGQISLVSNCEDELSWMIGKGGKDSAIERGIFAIERPKRKIDLRPMLVQYVPRKICMWPRGREDRWPHKVKTVVDKRRV